MRKQFLSLGVRAKSLPEAKAEPNFRVLAANWPPLLFFLGLQTQWRMLLVGQRHIYLGLDYTAVESTMRMDGVKNRKAMLRDLRVMESTALVFLNDGTASPKAYPGVFAWPD